ncbi:MAG TPA: hypothetical protein ENK83_04760, partial [Aliiroseovarius sp.]|nr:hypothetical protein [Aliiroseovarius sp.]
MSQEHNFSPLGRGRLVVLWGLLLCVNLAMAFGVTKVRFDDGLAQVFQSSRPAYAAYQQYLAD